MMVDRDVWVRGKKMLPRTRDPEFATPKARKTLDIQTGTETERKEEEEEEREKTVKQTQHCKRANTVTRDAQTQSVSREA